ncbi:MAG: TonB-dependent receptor plug domain-containing protein, partial [Gluconacetobacter diazotrophicus]|nr:TonB-dependent receptor plug domain-containing protein [Gluconacetobacter diazotrophicus]
MPASFLPRRRGAAVGPLLLLLSGTMLAAPPARAAAADPVPSGGAGSDAAHAAAVARRTRTPDTAAANPGNAPQVTAPNSRDAPALAGTPEESITVSANKRRQRTRDVAGSVTVLTGSQLEKLGAQGYADYLKQVPGAVFSEGIPGLSTVSFRGITDTNLLDQGQGTTGYFLNDVP